MKQYIKNGVIKSGNRIVIVVGDMQIINPTEEMIIADGWVEYIPEPVAPTPYRKSPLEAIEELVSKQFNERTDITNDEALDYMVLVYPWEYYIGQTLQVGKIVAYKEKLYRVRQSHEVLDIYPPSIDTASLYESIDREHEGTFDDPIPYTPPMEIFEGKYYTQDDTLYLCTRDSGTALTHNLADIIGLYVELK